MHAGGGDDADLDGVARLDVALAGSDEAVLDEVDRIFQRQRRGLVRPVCAHSLPGTPDVVENRNNQVRLAAA